MLIVNYNTTPLALQQTHTSIQLHSFLLTKGKLTSPVQCQNHRRPGLKHLIPKYFSPMYKLVCRMKDSGKSCIYFKWLWIRLQTDNPTWCQNVHLFWICWSISSVVSSMHGSVSTAQVKFLCLLGFPFKLINPFFRAMPRIQDKIVSLNQHNNGVQQITLLYPWMSWLCLSVPSIYWKNHKKEHTRCGTS